MLCRDWILLEFVRADVPWCIGSFYLSIALHDKGQGLFIAMMNPIRYNEVCQGARGGGHMELTARMRTILSLLLAAYGYVTAEHIAAELGVSARTVTREMHGIETALKS